MIILVLTISVFLMLHQRLEQNCVDKLRSAAEASDWQAGQLLGETYLTMKNISVVLSEHTDFDASYISKLFDSLRIGDLEMEERLYLPDGGIITEKGLWSGNCSTESYQELIGLFDPEGRYISCTRKDYIHEDRDVMEFYCPVIKNGETTAVLSTVVDLSVLNEHFYRKTLALIGNVVLIDLRDGTYFLDTNHKGISGIDAMRDRSDKKGNSISPMLDRIMDGQEVYFTIKSQRSGSILHNYTVPSTAYPAWSVSISNKEENAFALDIFVRKLLIALFAAELILFAVYLLWLRKSTRREVEKAQKIAVEKAEAELSNKAKTEFLFNMTHDIRTPMNAILGYTDIAINHSDERERVDDSLRKIKSSGGHLLNLINNILEMSRIEAGRMEIICSPVNIYDISDGIINMSQTLASEKEINFRSTIGEIRNPYVYADELHINQILINLISNAVKYTKPGGTVEYTIEQRDSENADMVNCRFTVKDNGIGMSEEFQKHLFESFTREQTATVSRQEGAGLGLAIVKRIAALSGGTITVQSKQGIGSTFTLDLPLQAMDDDAIEAFERSRHSDEEISEAYALEGKKVLLVDDNELNREIAADILEEAGMLIDQAEDGAIAVRLLKEIGVHCYDFILMDIRMPVMNGYKATAEIRKLPDGDAVPIIALSANAFQEDIEKSHAAGMNAHLAKPINVGELFSTLAKFL